MKNLLLIISVLFSASLSAVEEIWEYNATTEPGYSFYAIAVGNDGSAAIKIDDDILWVGSSGQTIRTLNGNFPPDEAVYSVSDNHLLITENTQSSDGYDGPDNLLLFYPSGNPELLASGFNVSINSSDSSSNYICYRKNNSTLAMMQISNNPTNSSVSSIPSNAVVIPSDSSGPVQIILESSEDMVNWNSANPGTYGASTNERFFRIRAVQDTE